MNDIAAKDIEEFSKQILYEDNHLLIINKKVGQVVHKDKTGDISLIQLVKSYLKIKYNKPGNVYAGLVHRIDRPTSGIVVFTKTSKSLLRLMEMMKKREIKKIYHAIIRKAPIPREQKLINYLIKNQEKNKTIVYNHAAGNSKEAILSYKIIKESDNYFLLEIDLETGRHHQIRAQLSKIGSPIKGDLKYGFPRSNLDGGISLHAKKIEFEHPIKKVKILVECDPFIMNDWKMFYK